ncbi:conjugative transposon protein [Enterococcus asini]|nr:conjugative transposon protein [Enterococcus asini]
MKQVNLKNQLARPPPNNSGRAFLYPKLKRKEEKNMELKFVVPDMAETFGKLTYGGEGEVLTEGYGRNTTVIGRSYHLFSSKQRADDIEVVVAAEAGEKDFDQDQPLKAVNPHLVAKGYEIENRGFTDYVLYVDDLVKA